ncbi:CLUMA_CG003429, isoform A [Clunio marinus]|uniref:CLUMA_CG003429, isoform A n=1 Tax=Clunio marinus TaxID=568069 RepID=A0A1J1HP86_9DIPT|nr:CLUMA_CG003429, isoform A [Clunio marinus]
MIAMIKKFFLFFLRIFRRALCCFSRKRSDSKSDYEGRLEVVNVVDDSPNFKKSNTLDRDWNSWDDKPRTIEEHIEVYRENLVKPKEPELVSETQNIDLFADMAPKIIKQKKVLINQGKQEQPSFSRLEATASAEIPIINELEDWNENQQAGWDEINDQNTKKLIRETRKELRASKHKPHSITR